MFDDESQVSSHSFRFGECWTGENLIEMLPGPDSWRRRHKGDDSLLQVRESGSPLDGLQTMSNHRLRPWLLSLSGVRCRRRRTVDSIQFSKPTAKLPRQEVAVSRDPNGQPSRK